MHRAARAVLVAGVAAAAVLFVWPKWAFALDLEAGTRDVLPELMLEVYQPGLLETVALVTAAAGPVYTMRREQDPLSHQRVLEMVYPRRLRPYDAATLRAGDLVVLAAGHALEVPNDEVLARGELRVVRVRR